MRRQKKGEREVVISLAFLGTIRGDADFWFKLFSLCRLGFALAFRFGGKTVGQGFVATDGAGIFPRPLAIGHGVLQAVPGSDFRLAANDAAAFFGAAELPFLLARDREFCELVNNFFACVFSSFRFSFFHIFLQ